MDKELDFVLKEYKHGKFDPVTAIRWFRKKNLVKLRWIYPAVAAAAAGVVAAGVTLLKKHTKYMTEKAAATFDPEDEEDWFDEAESFTEVEESEEALIYLVLI